MISAPFHHGLVIVFTAAAIMSFIGALVSLLRGKQFYYTEPGAAAPVPATVAGPAQDTAPNGNGAHGNGANGDSAHGNGANGSGAHRDTADQDAAARSARGGRG